MIILLALSVQLCFFMVALVLQQGGKKEEEEERKKKYKGSHLVPDL